MKAVPLCLSLHWNSVHEKLFTMTKLQKDSEILTVKVELHCGTMAAIHGFEPLFYFPPIAFSVVRCRPPCIYKLVGVHNSVMLVRGYDGYVVEPLISE